MKTVTHHVTRILRKLQLRNRTQVAQWAAAHIGATAEPQAATIQIPSSDSSVMRYGEWLGECTATFTIPGLGVPLPIDRAWVALQTLRDDGDRPKPKTLKEQLAAYQEWERLTRQGAGRPALDVADHHRRVVVGGAGAGKTTLCIREAHILSAEGKRVLYVRLPAVARRHARGETITDALLADATEGFAENTDVLRRGLDPPDHLLGDGLDECGPEYGNFTRALVAWALARPNTRVTLTTRPVGHDPAAFPDWVHQELLPLDRDELHEHAEQLIQAACDDRTEADAALGRFDASLTVNKVASVAARSPLLLSFLVQLAIRCITPKSRRAGLYEQVLALWVQRDGRSYTPRVSQVIADRMLDVAGWLLQQALESGQGSSRRELVNGLANQLVATSSIALFPALKEAERYLQFWDACGVLEHLQVGGEDAYVFVHPTLREYAAARYVMALEEGSRQEWLHSVRPEPRWREVILLAAGVGPARAIVGPLLDAEDLGDPAGTECFLAAAALAEAAQAPRQLTERVAERIAARLSSPAPLVAFEASEAAVDIAGLAPAIVAGLVSHSQEWTRIAAFRLQLEADPKIVDLDALEAFLQTPSALAMQSGIGASLEGHLVIERSAGRDCWQEVVRLGAAELVSRRGGAHVLDLVEDHAYELQRVGHAIRAEQLSERERQILPLLAVGWTNREIATQLGLRVGTVKNNVARILEKLDVSDRTQAAVRAVELGLAKTTH